MNSGTIPYPITTLQQAHRVAGALINQGIPERYRQTLILAIFETLTQTEAWLDRDRLTAQELIRLLPAETILEAAEELTAKAY